MRISKCFIIALLTFVMSLAQAQKPKHFDPERFQRDLEQFIATQACLSPAESAEFFPIYREMRNKQWAYFATERRLRHIDTSDNQACAEAISKRDAGDLELKRIQQTYHEKFMTILPASKVYLIIKAEDNFHRRLFKQSNGTKKKTN